MWAFNCAWRTIKVILVPVGNRKLQGTFWRVKVGGTMIFGRMAQSRPPNRTINN